MTAQRIETKLMPNENLGRDLQIMHMSLYVKSLLHGVICVTMNETESKCFCHILSFFLLLATFRQMFAQLFHRNC